MMTEARMKREEANELADKVWRSLAWLSGTHEVKFRGEYDIERDETRLVVYITIPEEREEDEN